MIYGIKVKGGKNNPKRAHCWNTSYNVSTVKHWLKNGQRSHIIQKKSLNFIDPIYLISKYKLQIKRFFKRKIRKLNLKFVDT